MRNCKYRFSETEFVMNHFPKILTLACASFILLSLSSCTSTELQAESPVSSEASQPSEPVVNLASQASNSPPEKPLETSPVLKAPTAPANTIPLTLYRVDSQCESLISQQVTVPVDQALEMAVAKTLEIQQLELPLGYRMEVDHDYQIAVIDLRVPTTSRRTLNSLSACEQLALFGSLRETLTQNPDLQIQEVYFTHLGEDLIL
jgi:hypothetical protein